MKRRAKIRFFSFYVQKGGKHGEKNTERKDTGINKTPVTRRERSL